MIKLTLAGGWGYISITRPAIQQVIVTPGSPFATVVLSGGGAVLVEESGEVIGSLINNNEGTDS